MKRVVGRDDESECCRASLVGFADCAASWRLCEVLKGLKILLLTVSSHGASAPRCRQPATLVITVMHCH